MTSNLTDPDEITALMTGTTSTTDVSAGEPDEKPAIQIGGEAETIRALTTAMGQGALPDVYVSGGQLVHLSRVSGKAASAAEHAHQVDAGALPVQADPITSPSLAWLLAHHAFVFRRKKNKDTEQWEEVEASPTKAALSAVLSSRYWPDVRPLVGVVTSPVLRPDGTLLQTAGYDTGTGLYYAPTVAMPAIPAQPSQEQVSEALEFVTSTLLRNFPFVADADKANHIGLMIAPILRPYLGCLTPFGLISATTQSSGKTLLAEIPGYIYGLKHLVWRNNDENELQKSITSALHSTAAVMLWDNLAEGTEVSSAVLAKLLTGPKWDDRNLGSNSAGFEAVNDRLWLATGNNIRLGGDMATRTALVRLDPNDPHPDQRDQTGFGIPHLDQWLKKPANRVTVLRHLLILVMDWINAGAPRSGHTMRQFSTWAGAAGGFLAHHGVDGFLDNVAEMREADDENTEWTAFLARWHELHGKAEMRARVLCHSAEPEINGTKVTDRWDGTFLTDERDRIPSSKSLGKLLTGHIGRWHGPHVLRSRHDKSANSLVFWVETNTEPDHAEHDQTPADKQQTALI
ncbi:hypothetical protein [Lentzea flaviverrucosa]|uniref:Uncharacterized protein n=1 Tax=Lentzea flaviverrucosa TaxID=200379 RepID=A0A1H9XK88_9PSEU|nr:hypothetical protein [Lentzea flaviverrucosa]RDI20323.1 hypothetical protein DFR72_115166 [Lentzea flaviverrucosa]SES46585.1 hypothetical protein SAMN05216195_115166 [Lentzea flaviverrucosa]